MDNDAIEGRLVALEYMLSQLLKDIPQVQKDAMLAEARGRFTGHSHRPNFDAEAMVVVKSAYGVPGPDRK